MGQYVSFVDDESGIAFAFKREPGHPELLHIFARHLTDADDAISAFFEGEHIWNAKHRRFETVGRTHTVYWIWWREDSQVMVISCFKNEDW